MKKTLFLQSADLDKLQAKVNEHEAQGWAFFSLSVGMASRPATDGTGSAAQVIHDMGLQGRLFVAALQRDDDAAK